MQHTVMMQWAETCGWQRSLVAAFDKWRVLQEQHARLLARPTLQMQLLALSALKKTRAFASMRLALGVSSQQRRAMRLALLYGRNTSLERVVSKWSMIMQEKKDMMLFVRTARKVTESLTIIVSPGCSACDVKR